MVDAMRRARLMLIEDNDIDAEFVRRLVRRAALDIEILHAVDGPSACDLVQSLETEQEGCAQTTVFLDRQLPRMSGLEFLSHARSQGWLKNAKVYLLSSTRLPADFERAKSLGVEACLNKPIDKQTLLDVLSPPHSADQITSA